MVVPYENLFNPWLPLLLPPSTPLSPFPPPPPTTISSSSLFPPPLAWFHFFRRALGDLVARSSQEGDEKLCGE